MLYDIENDMDIVLGKLGINPASQAFRHAKAAILLAAKQELETPTLRLGGRVKGEIVISCGSSHYFRLGNMVKELNGIGVVFSDSIESWSYIPGSCPDVFGLRRRLRLTANDVKCLYSLLMTLLSGDPVPMLQILGPKGSGKTSLERLLLLLVYGRAIHPIAIPKEKRDFISALHQRRIVAIDNLECAPEWFQDIACTAVTGGVLTERKLYTNTGVVNIALDNWIITSSIDASSIQRDDIVSRSLFLGRGKISKYVSEGEIGDLILKSRDAILSHIVDLMRIPEPTATVSHRMVAWYKNVLKTGLSASSIDKISHEGDRQMVNAIHLIDAVKTFMDFREQRPSKGTIFYALLCECISQNKMSMKNIPESWLKMSRYIQRYAPEFERECGITLRESGKNLLIEWANG